jgi:hypothetical protein
MAVVAFAVLLALALGSKPADRPAVTYERPQLGLAVDVPEGWTIVRKSLTPCTDPAQRIAVRRRGALVQIVEQLSADVRGFPDRPRRFELSGRPEWLACCPPADGKGWFVPFRDRGRGFYAYVYADGPETRAQALEILDSLRMLPRPSAA